MLHQLHCLNNVSSSQTMTCLHPTSTQSCWSSICTQLLRHAREKEVKTIKSDAKKIVSESKHVVSIKVATDTQANRNKNFSASVDVRNLMLLMFFFASSTKRQKRHWKRNFTSVFDFFLSFAVGIQVNGNFGISLNGN